MPGPSYNLPATECKVGSKLRKVPGSTCSNCYACKGRYVFPNVQAALYRRFAAINAPDWVDNMVTAINGAQWFRWHDSGDIQTIEHLSKIVEVCKRTPTTRHWLPTREIKLVRAFLKSGAFPDNLTVRISATMIDGDAPKVASDWNRFVPTSTVHKHAQPIGHKCPAPAQGNKCADCRACWDRSIDNVSYGAH